VIAAGAGHEIGKHRFLSDGVCAPGAGGRRRKAKNDCAAGRKNLQKEEVRGDFVTRNQNITRNHVVFCDFGGIADGIITILAPLI
jgi:hypothetical protein